MNAFTTPPTSPPAHAHPIPVICDKCRAEGLAGEADFAGLGDLLDFEPVPLQVERVDGWNPECQRAFIAALSVLGSSDRAARAVGKSAPGAQRLRRLPGAEGFVAAWEKAKAISYERGTLRLANSLKTAKAAAPDPAARPAPAPAPPEPDDAALLAAAGPQLEALDAFFGHYLRRLGMERDARLAGRIVEADFYVRQITHMEVMLDLLSGDGWAWLDRQRFRGNGGRRFLPAEVAETPMSRLLDEARRAYWAEGGEPERPPLPPPDQLEDHGRFKTGGQVAIRGGPDWREQERAIEARQAEAARAQVEWEAQARRDYERRREEPPLIDGEPGRAGRPAAEADRTDVTNSVRDGHASED